jgi:predicted nucleic acid-binding protein
MICDSTFLIDLARSNPDAQAFLAARRSQPFWVPVISAGELAAGYDTVEEARAFLDRYRILRLTPEVAYAAAAIDRELITTGDRLGENDNWIAGFCRYYGQPVISRDAAFDRVRGLRRLAY